MSCFCLLPSPGSSRWQFHLFDTRNVTLFFIGRRGRWRCFVFVRREWHFHFPHRSMVTIVLFCIFLFSIFEKKEKQNKNETFDCFFCCFARGRLSAFDVVPAVVIVQWAVTGVGIVSKTAVVLSAAIVMRLHYNSHSQKKLHLTFMCLNDLDTTLKGSILCSFETNAVRKGTGIS